MISALLVIITHRCICIQFLSRVMGDREKKKKEKPHSTHDKARSLETPKEDPRPSKESDSTEDE